MSRVCDMCGRNISSYGPNAVDDEELKELYSINVCLGGDNGTVDLCNDCARKVGEFIEKNKKE